MNLTEAQGLELFSVVCDAAEREWHKDHGQPLPEDGLTHTSAFARAVAVRTLDAFAAVIGPKDVWAAWNAIDDPVDVIAAQLSVDPAYVASIVFPEAIFGPCD
jgi:hypothetical protein